MKKEVRTNRLSHAFTHRVRSTLSFPLALLEGKAAIRAVRGDLPPPCRTKLRFVESVNLENDGYEEKQIH